MREFTCIFCGKVDIDYSPEQNKKYCSRQCCDKHRQARPLEPCKYNVGVLCSSKKCHKCGWNPEVEKIRKEKLEKEC